jgi:FkbM family methyltransferase
MPKQQLNEVIDLTRQVMEMQRLTLRILRQSMLGSAIPISNGRLLTRTSFGHEMFIDNRDTGSGLNIVSSGKIEPNVMRFIHKFMLAGSVFLDIGANFGFYSMLAAQQVGAEGKVYSFEANPFLEQFIEDSAYVNGVKDRVKVINKAVSDHTGAARFGFSYSGIGGGSLEKGREKPEEARRVEASKDEIIEVPLTTVDDELPQGTIVACAKFDVEGAELPALRGMAEVIRRSEHIVIIMEFFPPLLRPAGAEGVLDTLKDMGLSYWRINAKGRLDDVSKDELLHGGNCYIAAARRKPDDRALKLTPKAMRFGVSPDAEGYLSGPQGSVLVHGPYWHLQSGRYDITVVGEIEGDLQASFTHDMGFVVATKVINKDSPSFSIGLIDDVRYFEVVLRAVDTSTRVKIDRIEIVERL